MNDKQLEWTAEFQAALLPYVTRAEKAEADSERMRAAIREVWEFIEEGGSRSQHVLDLLRPFVEDAKGPEHTRNILLGAVKEYYEGASSEVSEAVPTGGERIPGPADNAECGGPCDACGGDCMRTGPHEDCVCVEHVVCSNLGVSDHTADMRPCARCEAIVCSAHRYIVSGIPGHGLCEDCTKDPSIIERHRAVEVTDEIRDLQLSNHARRLIEQEQQIADLTARIEEHGKRIDGIKERVVQLGQNLDASALLRMADRVAEVEQRLTAVEQCHNEGETIALFEHHKQQVNALVGRLDRRMEWLASALPRHFSVPVDNLASATCEQLNEFERRLTALELAEPATSARINVVSGAIAAIENRLESSLGVGETEGCLEQSPDASHWVCTEPQGHRSQHVARKSDRTECHRWPASARPSEEETDE